MATKLCEVPNNFVGYIDMKYDLFHREKVIEYFFSSCAQIVWFLCYIIKSVARECVSMVTNHIASSQRIFSPNTIKLKGWAFQ